MQSGQKVKIGDEIVHGMCYNRHRSTAYFHRKEENSVKITKKNGTVSLYDDEKVAASILKANAEAPDEIMTKSMAAALADEVFARLTEEHDFITTADVRKCVTALLKERGLTDTAARYDAYQK